MKKTLLIGLDGASFDILMPWIKEGKLPVLEKLINKGTHGILKSTIPCVTCPALPTIYTGINPGNLGVFSFLDHEGSVVSSSKIPYKSIWHILTEKKKRSLISNLRTTYPPEEINGTMICSLHSIGKKLGVDSWEKTESSWVYPKKLQKELDGWAINIENFVKNIIDKLLSGDMEGYENIKKLEKFRALKFKELLLRDEYDFGFHWIEHTDTINHLCWGRKDLILRCYQEIIEPILDDYLNTFKDWNILIISDHGTAVEGLYDFHVNTWLMKKDYLKTNWFFMPEIVSLALPLFRKIKGWFPSIKVNVENKKGRTDNNEKNDIVLSDNRNEIRGVDWNNTVAYSDITWGIRINRGKIKDKDEYESLREKIIADLKDLKKDSDFNVIQNAWKREEIYSGKYLDQIPDIIILPQNYLKHSRVIINEVLKQSAGSNLGGHTYAIDGIFIANGPDIKMGKEIDSLRLIDIVPTILFMLDLEVSNELDGRVIKEIFSENSDYYKKEIKYTEETVKRTHEIRNLSECEEKEMKKMLASLGYFE